ncbi:MAG: hypothetical protein ACK5JM_04355 [Rhodoblastus sp.]
MAWVVDALAMALAMAIALNHPVYGAVCPTPARCVADTPDTPFALPFAWRRPA